MRRIVTGVMLLAACALVLIGTRGDAAHRAAAVPVAATLDLRAPAGVKAVPHGTRVLVTWHNRARDGRTVEVRAPRTATRRVPAARRKAVVALPKAGVRIVIRLRACAAGGRPCGPFVRKAFQRVETTATNVPPGSGPGPLPTVGSCPVRPATDPWNTDIANAPVDPRSDAYIASIGAGGRLHPDFGSGQYGDYGIPYAVVPAGQPKVPIRFTAYGDESDAGPYPIPPNAHVEGGSDADGDRHVLVVQEGDCKLYELYHAHKSGDGWTADSGAVFDLRSSALRPAGWTSADAAGLPILPGLARADEASAGAIRHALRFTVSRSQNAYVAPARHAASSSSDPDRPPMGLRLRLKAGYDRARFHGQARAILDALATYGMIVADNGSDWFISGTPDPRWDDDDLDQLKTVPGSAFEVVKPSSIVKGR